MATGCRAIAAGAALAVLLVWPLFGRPLLAQAAAELKPLGRDEARQSDRYQVILHPGAALWDIASTYLPLTALDEGDTRAYELVLDSFRRAFPGQPPGLLQADETFPLDVPPGTFVTEQLARDGNSLVYRSFQGDQLTSYSRHPSLVYRLVRKDAPDRVDIKLTGQANSAVDLAREIYRVDPPDFIQVRTARAALSDPNARVTVDLARRYLDDFWNYRERATSVKDGEGGRKVYIFGPDEPDNPFVRIEDAVVDQTDPGTFPREFRLAFYRDGTVRKYLVTESGDALATLNRPDPSRWQEVLPDVDGWQPGELEPLPPFAPAANQAGSLIPGRLLVLSFARREVPPTSSAVDRSPAGRTAPRVGDPSLPQPLIVLWAGAWGFGALFVAANVFAGLKAWRVRLRLPGHSAMVRHEVLKDSRGGTAGSDSPLLRPRHRPPTASAP